MRRAVLFLIALLGFAAPASAQFFVDTMTNPTLNAVLADTVSSSGHEWTRHALGASQEFRYDNANRVHVTEPYGGSIAYPEVTPPSPDYSVTCAFYVHTVTPGDYTQRQYPACGIRTQTDALTYYAVFYDTYNGRWVLESRVANVGTDLGTYTQALSTATAYSVMITAVGTAISVYIDGVLRIGELDGAITTAGKPSIGDYHDAASTNTTLIHISSVEASAVTVATSFFSDALTNSEGIYLDTTFSSSGHDWLLHPGNTHGFVYGNANRVFDPTAGGYTVNHPDVTPPSADYYVECVFYVFTSTNSQYPACGVRLNTAVVTMYQVLYDTLSARWEIEEVTAGVYATLASSAMALTNNTAYTVRLTAEGSNLTVHVDGVLKISHTDASITAAGRPSMNDYTVVAGSNTANIHHESINAASFTAPPPPASRSSLLTLGVD